MNNAKLWLVVNPTVGIPLFLGAVAVGSFSVHVAILRNTTWVGNFLQGKPLNTAKSDIEVPAGAGTASVVFNTPASGAREAVLVMPDGRTARVVFDAPASVAALAPPATANTR
jgi:light-harvesting protein B-800-850 alpha chain